MATSTPDIEPSVQQLDRSNLRAGGGPRLRGAGRLGQEALVPGSDPRPKPTPMLEEEGLPRGALGESCAIMAGHPLQQARSLVYAANEYTQ